MKLKIETVQTVRDGDASHIYVNGKKTNLYWFESSYKYFDQAKEERAKTAAFGFVSLLKSGDAWIDAEQAEEFTDGKSYRIDQCSFIKRGGFQFTGGEIVADHLPYRNNLFSCTDYGQSNSLTDQEMINSVVNRVNSEGFLQWIKLMPEDCSKIYKRLGIKRGNNGYSVYAIE